MTNPFLIAGSDSLTGALVGGYPVSNDARDKALANIQTRQNPRRKHRWFCFRRS